MAENKLKRAAELSPGLATAMAQTSLAPREKDQIIGLVSLTQMHKELSALPQGKAYDKYSALDKQTKKALSSMFDAKYVKDDRGFFGNILESVKSAAYYGGNSTFGILKQVVGLDNPLGLAGKTTEVAFAGIKSATEQLPASAKTAKATGTAVGGVLESLVRPQNKLVKQPYMAQRLAEVEGKGSYATLGKFFLEGFKELMPGGEDATPSDNSTDFKSYWERASEPNNVYDDNVVMEINKELSPDASFVGQMLASKKDLVENFETYADNPAVLKLINDYVAGDEEASRIVADATARFEKAKISPGRDVARAVVSLLPYEAERAVNGDGAAKILFNSISGTVDFGVTIGLDPLIIAGKFKRGIDVARFSFTKFGEKSTVGLEQAFQNRGIRGYWNEIGFLAQQYRKGNLEEKGLVLNRLNTRFREVNNDVFKTLVDYDVRNADDAASYFQSGERFQTMMSGGIGFGGRDSLVPRYTLGRQISDKIKDFANLSLGTNRFSKLETVSGATIAAKTLGESRPIEKQIEDFTAQFSENPSVWADKIGVEKSGIKYTQKDKRFISRIDQFTRQFAIAPQAQRMISISDGSSANQIFAMARTTLDTKSAGSFRAAWLGGDEGQRLQMLQGLLKTIGYGMGLNHTDEGKIILSKIDEMSTELYSVNQDVVNLGNLADSLKTLNAKGLPNPGGVRRLVQDAMIKTTGNKKVTRLLASVNGDLANISAQVKALKEAKALAKSNGVDDIVETIDEQLKILGARFGITLRTQKALKAKIGDKKIDDVEELDLSDIPDIPKTTINVAEVNGTQRAIRLYQLSNTRRLPDFQAWRLEAARAGVLTSVFGKATNAKSMQILTDAWSFGNLFPRLGIRTTVEELGTYFLIGGTENFASYIRGRQISRELRAASPNEKKTTVLRSIFTLGVLPGKEKEVNNLGVVYNSLFKIMGRHYTPAEKAAMLDDKELLGRSVASAMLKDRIVPGFLRTKSGKETALYAEDFARFEGQTVLNDIVGASYAAETKADESVNAVNSLKQFGPSVALNVSTQEALKGMKFADQFTQMNSFGDKFLFNWLLELNNVIGKRNGQFGNIVLWNAGKKQDAVIKELVKYIDGEGQDIAKRFAIFSEEGSYGLATRMYADITYPLRGMSGRINMDLVKVIRDKGGMKDFTLDDLVPFDTVIHRPEALIGKEIIPLGAGTPEQMTYRLINNGYQWIGKQIALLDREPIMIGNYTMFRKELSGTESIIKQQYINNGLDEASADSIARFTVHETAMNLARNRTLGFVDNSDIRTNLAYNLRTFGRYYRATEDFYRRAARLVKYEKRAIVRLAIMNQSFEHSGFVNKDNNGQLYFTYPGDDILNTALLRVFSNIGISTYSPVPVSFGGYIKMLTPSLDPESAPPRLSNPLVSVALDTLTNLPHIGKYLVGTEKIVTGTFNPDLPLWEKVTPVNIKRVIKLLNDNPDNSDSRYSSAIKSMRMMVANGNGPTNPSQIDTFLRNSAIQAENIDMVRFWKGLFAPASVQVFANKDIQRELKAAGVFTWDSEFQKFMKKYDGDLNKSLISFSKLYPSKLAWTTSASQSDTKAQFQKTYEAVEFVKNNKSLILEHNEGASFFIPVSGTSDFESYSFLKAQGYVKNKEVETFLRQVSTVDARQAYYAINDEYNAKIAANPNPLAKRFLRDELKKRKDGMMMAYPLLREQVTPNAKEMVKKEEALSDLRNLLIEKKAPNKKLGDIYSAMISEYDDMNSLLRQYQGYSNQVIDMRKKQIKADTRDTLVQLSSGNENATALFNIIFDSLIGE